MKNLMGHTITLYVEKQFTVYNVKSQLEDKSGIAIENQKLMFVGKELQNEQILREMEPAIGKESTLHLLPCKSRGKRRSEDRRYLLNRLSDAQRAQYVQGVAGSMQMYTIYGAFFCFGIYIL